MRAARLLVLLSMGAAGCSLLYGGSDLHGTRGTTNPGNMDNLDGGNPGGDGGNPSNGSDGGAVKISFPDGGSSYQTASYPVDVEAADLDKNGKMDLVVSERGSDRIAVLMGDGHGAFTTLPTDTFATAATPYGLALADFNGDNKIDVAVGSDSGVSILLGGGDGTFATHVEVSSYPGIDPDYLVAGDFNGDSKMDLAVSNTWDDTVTLLLGAGNGTFTVGQTIALDAASTDSSLGIATADLDANGKPDVLVLADVESSAPKLAVLLNKTTTTGGAAVFAAPVLYAVRVGSSFVAAGKLNGDAYPDVVVTDENDSLLQVLLNQGNGTFSMALPPALHTYPGASGACDTNNFGSGAAGTCPLRVLLGDFNGDGKLDAITANFGASDLSVMAGDGMGSFGAPSLISTGGKPEQVCASDFNGDSQVDLAVPQAVADVTSIYLNTSH